MGQTVARVGMGIMTGGISELVRMGAKQPAPPEAPPITASQTVDAAPVQEASAQAAARRSKSAGFRSTILSRPDSTLTKIGGQGLKDTIGA